MENDHPRSLTNRVNRRLDLKKCSNSADESISADAVIFLMITSPLAVYETTYLVRSRSLEVRLKLLILDRNIRDAAFQQKAA